MRKFLNLLLIVLAALIIFALVYPLFKEKSEADKIKEKDEELLKELENLKNREEIIEKCLERDIKNEKLLQAKADKWYRIIMQSLISVYALVSIVIYFAASNEIIADLITWKELVFSLWSLLNAFLLLGVRFSKPEIKNSVQGIIQSQVFKKRDAEYFLARRDINLKELKEIKKRKVEIKDERIHNKLDNLSNPKS